MKKILAIAIGAVLVVVLLLMGCGGAAKPAADSEIRIGTVQPLTGMFAGFGTSSLWGIKAAAEDINKQGGIFVQSLGKKLPVRVMDANCESDGAKVGTLAEDMVVRSKVHAFLSPDAPSDLTAPVSTVGERNKIPSIIGGGPFEPWNGMRTAVTPPWEYTWLPGFAIATPAPAGDFRAVPGYTIKDSWFEFLNLYAKQTNGIAGVFATDEPDGVGWYGLFPGLLKEYGLKVIGAEQKLGFYPVTTTDFSSIVKAWQDAKVEILWGNTPGPAFGAMWQSAARMGFKPKICSVGRAALFYTEVKAWGGDLPNGVGTEVWWDPAFPADQCPGIGGTTAQSLADRWAADQKQPLLRGIGHGYHQAQILFDSIERAGSLDGTAISNAIGDCKINTIWGKVQFDKNTHFSHMPLFFGQWFKTNQPEVWDLSIVISQHSWLKAPKSPVYPLP